MSDTDLFSSLVGQRFGFYGVDNYAFKIGKHVFEAIEDPSDGYRSMQEVAVKDPSRLIFFKKPCATVTLNASDMIDEYEEKFDGWVLVDDIGHVWLRFGTANNDDYYPLFIFCYSPVSR